MYMLYLSVTIHFVLVFGNFGQRQQQNETIIRDAVVQVSAPNITFPYTDNSHPSNIPDITLSQPGQVVAVNPIPLEGSSGCTISNIIQGFGYDDSNFIPPDPIGAAGVSRLVAVANSLIEVRKKDGTLMYRSSLAELFPQIDTTPPSNYIFDPKVIYDEHEGRFVVVGLQRVDSTNTSSIFLAVSKNENPDTMDAWYKYKIPATMVSAGRTSWADYPGFEVDEKAVYIMNNMFEFGTRAYAGARLWIVPKGVVGGFYGGGSATFFGPYNPYQSNNLYSTTTMPAQVHGVGGIGSSVGTYLVSVLAGSSTSDTFVQIITTQNPLTGPTFNIEYVSLGQIAQDTLTLPDAPQPGTTMLLDTGEVRALDAVWRNNKLWLTFTINPKTPNINAGQATACWARIDTTGGIFTLEGQGELGGESFSSKTSTYYPSIAVNKRGVVATGYAASSPTMYAGAYGSILLSAGEVPFTVKAGIDYYVQTDGIGRNRWGDYTGVSVDPIDDSFWIFNEFANNRGTKDSMGEDGSWGTVWAKVSCSSPSPIKVPTSAPIGKAPTSAPIKKATPTSAPIKKVPTAAPVRKTTPTSAPIKQTTPTSAPIKKTTPTSAPIKKVPTAAPLKIVPTAAPIQMITPTVAPVRMTTPTLAPIKKSPTVAPSISLSPASPPFNTAAPSTAPSNSPFPTRIPIDSPKPTIAPSRNKFPCGIFGFSLFCPLSGCGFFRRLFGIGGC